MAANNTIKFEKIPSRSKTSKCCHLTQTKNDDNDIGQEENVILFHENKFQVDSSTGFVKLVMQTALQKDRFDVTVSSDGILRRMR